MSEKNEHKHYEDWLNDKPGSDDAILDKIVSEVDGWKLPEPKVGYSQFKEVLQGKSKIAKTIPLFRYISIAASIAVILGGAFFSYINYFTIQTIICEVGNTKEISLPDGSVVILNGESSLEYNEWGWESDRVVNLVGQGYISVNKKGPFQVDMDNWSVDVLGTQFDVLNAHNAKAVKCFEGKVKVSMSENESILLPGDGVRLLDSSLEGFKFVSTAPSWLDAYTVLEDAPFSEVVALLNLRYGLEFIGVEIVDQLRFTGQFPNNNKASALEMVFGTVGVNFEEKEGIVTLK